VTKDDMYGFESVTIHYGGNKCKNDKGDKFIGGK
jgi:hypothetical protein